MNTAIGVELTITITDVSAHFLYDHLTTQETTKGSEVVALLREHNKRSTVDGSSTLTALAAVPTVALVPGKMSTTHFFFYFAYSVFVLC